MLKEKDSHFGDVVTILSLEKFLLHDPYCVTLASCVTLAMGAPRARLCPAEGGAFLSLTQGLLLTPHRLSCVPGLPSLNGVHTASLRTSQGSMSVGEGHTRQVMSGPLCRGGGRGAGFHRRIGQRGG